MSTRAAHHRGFLHPREQIGTVRISSIRPSASGEIPGQRAFWFHPINTTKFGSASTPFYHRQYFSVPYFFLSLTDPLKMSSYSITQFLYFLVSPDFDSLLKQSKELPTLQAPVCVQRKKKPDPRLRRRTAGQALISGPSCTKKTP